MVSMNMFNLEPIEEVKMRSDPKEYFDILSYKYKHLK